MANRGWPLAACISLALLMGLASAGAIGALTLTDTAGRQVALAATPERIVALTPSAIETLFAIGAGPAVVGRGASPTAFPPEAEALPVVDSVEAIIRLRPDLVVSHPNHHRFSPQILEHLQTPTLLLQHRSVAEVLANITLLGAATGRDGPAEVLRRSLHERVQRLIAPSAASRPQVLLLFGTPRSFLAMGEDTYAGDLLRLAGGQNVASQFMHHRPGGFHPLSLELIVKSRPQWVLVVSHGDPARVAEAYRKELESNPAWRRLGAVSLGRVHVLPDDLFATSPGPRLDQALVHLRQVLSSEAAHDR